MFGPLGGFEILVLLVLGLLVFGPRRLPQIGRSLGRVIMEFRKAANEMKTSIEKEIDLEEVRKTARAIGRDIKRDLEEIDPREDLEPLKDPTGASVPCSRRPGAPGGKGNEEDRGET